MKKLAVILLAGVLLIGCWDSTEAQAKYNMFDEHRVDNEHLILVDRDTKVCYLQYGSTRNNITGETGGSECNPDHFEFCDERERYVYKDWHCSRWEKKVKPC